MCALDCETKIDVTKDKKQQGNDLEKFAWEHF
jgi:hypothetical protein